jgi:hypothetical protein
VLCQTAGTAIKAAHGVTDGSAPGDWSDSCSATTATVADGYAGDTYLKLRAQPAGDGSANTTWVCYRGSNPQAADFGGRVDVVGTSTATTPPSADSNYQACSSTPGNDLPPPHPLLAGALAGQPFMVDAYSKSGSAWVCAQVAGVGQRIAISAPSATTPAITNHVDQPKPPLPPATPGRAGYPSSTCQSAGGSSAKRATNLDAASGTHAWAYAWQPTATKADVCARVEGVGGSAGGMLELDVTGSPGVSLVLDTSTTDMSPCTLSVFSLTSPVVAGLSTSQPGGTPTSVCLVAGSTAERITLGTSGQPVLPRVTWTPDPGTP